MSFCNLLTERPSYIVVAAAAVVVILTGWQY